MILVNIESLLVEVFPAASASASRPVRQTLVIVDLNGFGLSQFWALKSIARRFFEVSQNYYPETYVPLSFFSPLDATYPPPPFFFLPPLTRGRGAAAAHIALHHA
jgi:CRAL/TRIO domain